MSKVYSFRLSDDNPREAQAREVIEAWGEEGYSLRHVVVEALLYFESKNVGHSELKEVVEQLQNLIMTFDGSPNRKSADIVLSHSFLDSVKQSAKKGVKI